MIGDLPSESGADSWQIRPRWRLQYDIADIDAPDGLDGSGSFDALRRARMGVDIELPDGFSVRIDGEVQDDPVQLIDAYLMWEKGDFIAMVGQQKAVNPLDLHSSNLNISFMERPAFYTAFNYGRGTGVMAGIERHDFGIYGGLFTDNIILLNDVDRNSIFADFRTYWSPKIGAARVHFGASYHIRDLNDFADIGTRYRQRPLVRITDTRYIGTPALNVAKEQRFGVEMAGAMGRFHAAGELHWLDASRTGASNAHFFGGYAEAGVFITNDSRPLKAGAFGAIKPKRPVGSGGLGAVQFNARYDYLDLNSIGVTGGKQNGYLASLVWTPVDYLRVMVNYARLEYSDVAASPAGGGDFGVDVVGVRFQVSY